MAQSVFFAIVVACAAVLFSMYAETQDRKLNALSECVTHTAKVQNYHGDMNSPEAWALFESLCE